MKKTTRPRNQPQREVRRLSPRQLAVAVTGGTKVRHEAAKNAVNNMR